MKRPVNKRITRYLIFDVIRRNLLAFGVGLLAVAIYGLWATNFAISRQTLEGRFVRWTIQQDDVLPNRPQVFVDLPDGRTVIATADRSWRPPEAGSDIQVEERLLFWFGKSYRILP